MQADQRAQHARFVAGTEPYRRELLAHCYRMLGSLDDAEDAVQETYLRAWRGYTGFQGRSSVRTWLYRIATNTCLTARRPRGGRVLPSGLDAATDNPHAAAAPDDSRAWLGPLPDALVTSESDDPAAIAATRNSVRLALIAAMQRLSGRQRAVLLLRDVLDFPAADVADMLGSTVAAVKSTLQRARAHLDDIADNAEQAVDPTDPRARALLAEYIAAFESADTAAMQQILRRDAAIELPGSRTWFAGNLACVAFLRDHALGAPGDWRMLPTIVNGQPAAAAYLRAADGVHRAFGIAVLTISNDGIRRITVFDDPALVDRCGLPATVAGRPG